MSRSVLCLAPEELTPELAALLPLLDQALDICTLMLDRMVLDMLGELGTDLGRGASISGTWRKLLLRLLWTLGLWRVGTGLASSSATGT